MTSAANAEVVVEPGGWVKACAWCCPPDTLADLNRHYRVSHSCCPLCVARIEREEGSRVAAARQKGRSSVKDCQAQTVDLRGERKVQSLDLERMRLAFVAATDEAVRLLGWKYEAIASAIDVDPSYLTKLRSGEKPLSLRHIAALPDEIEQAYARHYAESFGQVVVPVLRGDAAIAALAGVMVGVIRERDATALPTKADRMARAMPPEHVAPRKTGVA